MNFFADVKECWLEDRRLFIKTVIAGLALAGAVPVAVALAFAL